MRTFEEERSMVVTLFEMLLLNLVVLGCAIYSGSALGISLAAVGAVLVAFFMGFALGNIRVPEEQ